MSLFWGSSDDFDFSGIMVVIQIKLFHRLFHINHPFFQLFWLFCLFWRYLNFSLSSCWYCFGWENDLLFSYGLGHLFLIIAPNFENCMSRKVKSLILSKTSSLDFLYHLKYTNLTDFVALNVDYYFLKSPFQISN